MNIFYTILVSFTIILSCSAWDGVIKSVNGDQLTEHEIKLISTIFKQGYLNENFVLAESKPLLKNYDKQYIVDYYNQGENSRLRLKCTSDYKWFKLIETNDTISNSVYSEHYDSKGSLKKLLENHDNLLSDDAKAISLLVFVFLAIVMLPIVLIRVFKQIWLVKS